MQIKRLITIILVLIAFDCFGQNQELHKLYFYTEGDIGFSTDTTELLLVEHLHAGDSIFKICYKEKENVSSTLCYILDTRGVSDSISFIGTKNYYIKGNTTYTIYKFLIDDIDIADDEELIFYSPVLGIILRYSLAWKGYSKLFKSSSDFRTQSSTLLTDKIMMDCDFLTSPIPNKEP